MPAIDTKDLKSMIERDEDMLLVNTLPKESFEETKIPSAINIPQDQDNFTDEVEKAAGNKDKKIVVYCADVDCHSSTEAAKKLDGDGFPNVYDYRVGAKGWKEDIETTGPPSPSA